MGWVSRAQKRYYYRSRRVGRRVGREYYGGGDEARLAAALDAGRRALAEAWRREREAKDSTDGSVHRLCEVVDLFAEVALLAGGYHRHGSEWRRWRCPTKLS